MKILSNKIWILFVILSVQILFSQEKVVIFAINDPHGSIENFSKIKPLIAAEKKKNNPVYFVSAGDLFSGNPFVDFAEEKGFPMIDLLNKTHLDITVLGNHEFDYGQSILNKRIAQANFPFICDNISGGSDELKKMEGYKIITKKGISIAFVGVIETSSPNGKPLTHPKKLTGLEFTDAMESFPKFKNFKASKDVDLLVALTHYGSNNDEKVVENFGFIDLVIGGHNNQEYGKSYKDAFMVMSGKRLEKISKTTLTITDKKITDFKFELIDLSNPQLKKDTEIEAIVKSYITRPEFFEKIGSSAVTHNRNETACFYTDALRSVSGADIVLQNMGGVRNILKQGDITPFTIYSIDPFGNGFDTFEMRVSELKKFLENYEDTYSLSTELRIEKKWGEFCIIKNGKKLKNNATVTLSLNDYISKVNERFFEKPVVSYPKTTAEYLIQYIKQLKNKPVNYKNCLHREPAYKEE
ncbi:MAG: bifunctional metallophosphatase/5'-nucleotidase [Flavicella sp.]